MNQHSSWLPSFMDQLFDFNNEATEGEAIQFRLLEMLIVSQVMFYSWEWGFYINNKLTYAAFPEGLANYIDLSFLFEHSFALLNAGIISVLALIGLFRMHRYGYLGAFLLMHMQYVARFSQGKIGHGSNLTGIVLLIIALSIIIFPDKKAQAKAVFGLTFFFVGLAYESAAMCKMIASGLSWADGGHLWLWLSERSVDVFSETGKMQLNGFQKIIVQHWTVATLFLVSGLLTELMAFTLWFRKFRPYIATAIIGMHIGIYFLMNISFSGNILILVLIGYPWLHLINSLLQRRDKGLLIYH